MLVWLKAPLATVVFKASGLGFRHGLGFRVQNATSTVKPEWKAAATENAP